MSDLYQLDDHAASALYRLARERSPAVEHIGGLLRSGETTNFVSTSEGSKTGGTLKFPRGALAGLFHNHPPRERSARDSKFKEAELGKFSMTDVMQAKGAGVPSYISAGDQVFRYDPATGRTEEVLHQLPLDPIRKLYIERLMSK